MLCGLPAVHQGLSGTKQSLGAWLTGISAATHSRLCAPQYPPARVNIAGVSGDSVRLTPAASAAEAWPSLIALAAPWAAASEDEHAVSTDTAGPDKAKV